MTAARGRHARLATLRPDGSIAAEHDFDDACEIGRGDVDVAFPRDDTMADRHARVSVEGDGLAVEDRGEGSGVWVRLVGPDGRLVGEGDQLWLGAQILVVESADDGWRLAHHGADGGWRGRHAIPPDGAMIGRDSAIVLDADDGRLSRRHAQVVPETHGLRVYDRGARNGTFLRLQGRCTIHEGAEFRVGSQRFRVLPAPEPVPERTEEAAPSPASAESPAPLAEPPAPPMEPPTPPEAPPIEETPARVGLGARLRALGRRDETVPGVDVDDDPSPLEEATAVFAATDAGEAPVESAASADEETTAVYPVPDVEEAAQVSSPGVEEATVVLAAPTAGEATTGEAIPVVIEADGGETTFEARPGWTILEAILSDEEASAGPIDWECGDGGCGVCVVGVVEGAASLDAPDPATGEMKTIQITEQVAPDPNRYRLACLARVRGAVRLRKLS